MKLFMFLIVLVATLSSFDAMACGDSLHRVGKGVTYRVYTAPLPGNVLVYVQSEGAAQLADDLARSGHDVHVAANEEELEAELSKGGYDVVIAPFSDHDAVEFSTNEAIASNTTYLPVAMSGEEESLAKQSYDRVMLADKHKTKHYLKAIHVTLKSKA